MNPIPFNTLVDQTHALAKAEQELAALLTRASDYPHSQTYLSLQEKFGEIVGHAETCAALAAICFGELANDEALNAKADRPDHAPVH